jgi:hypothetical protein
MGWWCGTFCVLLLGACLRSAACRRCAMNVTPPAESLLLPGLPATLVATTPFCAQTRREKKHQVGAAGTSAQRY